MNDKKTFTSDSDETIDAVRATFNKGAAPGLEERMRASLAKFRQELGAHPYVAKREGRGAAGVWPALHRFLRPAYGLAAAAAVVLAAMLWWATSGPTPTMSAYASLAEAIENSKAAEWVHIVSTSQGKTRNEEWLSFRPFRRFTRDRSFIFLFDSVERRKYQYDIAANTVTIDPLEGTGNDQVSKAPNLYDAVMGTLKDAKGGAVSETSETIDGKKRLVFTLAESGTAPSGTNVTITRRYVVDPEAKRFVSAEAKVGDGETIATVVIDYPAEGPRDIYAIGVPRNAKVVNNVREDVLTLIRAVDKAREGFAPKYYAIVYKGSILNDGGYQADEISVVYKRNGRYRIERYLRGSMSRFWNLPPDDMAGLEAGVKAWKLWEAYFVEPDSQEVIHVHANDKGDMLRERQRVGWEQLTPEWQTWGVPIPAKGATLIAAADAAGKGAARRQSGIEKTVMGSTFNGEALYPQRERWYLDPERNYACDEMDHLRDAQAPWQDNKQWMTELKDDAGKIFRQSQVRKVLEYGETPAGQWYAKKVRIDIEVAGLNPTPISYSEVVVVHLDTTRDIPEAVFNADSITADKFDRTGKESQ